jgi:hypothetical protein
MTVMDISRVLMSGFCDLMSSEWCLMERVMRRELIFWMIVMLRYRGILLVRCLGCT